MADTSNSRLDAIAARHSYREGFNGRLSRYRIFRLEEALGGSTGRALEIGAGEGPITRWLAGRYERVDAIEPAAAFFEVLERDFAGDEHVHLERVTFEGFAGDPGYDAIVAAGVLEHVEHPVPFLEKARGLLAPGGRLCLTVPNAESLHRRVGLEMGMLGEITELGELDHKVGHYRYYTFDTLRADLEAAGFLAIELSGVVLKPLPNSKMDELSLEYCDALFEIGRGLDRYCAEIFAGATHMT